MSHTFLWILDWIGIGFNKWKVKSIFLLFCLFHFPLPFPYHNFSVQRRSHTLYAHSFEEWPLLTRISNNLIVTTLFTHTFFMITMSLLIPLSTHTPSGIVTWFKGILIGYRGRCRIKSLTILNFRTEEKNNTKYAFFLRKTRNFY